MKSLSRDDLSENEEKVRSLLASFVTGSPDDVPSIFHPLMDTRGVNDVRWILFHMNLVLERICSYCRTEASLLPSEFVTILGRIPKLFQHFRDASVKSGKGWEALFTAVVLIRILSRQDDKMLPIALKTKHWKVTWNEVSGVLSRYKKPADLISEINFDSSRPQINVCLPNHSQFERYDVIVSCSIPGETVQHFGYQAKDGRPVISTVPIHSFERSIVVFGSDKPGQSEQPNSPDFKKSVWNFPTQFEVCRFLGFSGEKWRPIAWEE